MFCIRLKLLALPVIGCFTCIFLVSSVSYSQTLTWYFGANAGIDFSKNPPQGISGPINTSEGCAAVSNAYGKVIFSTDGHDIFDRNGNLVYSGLKGDASSTHSALIVPHPANPCSRFFIFTVGASESTTLQYGLQVVEVNIKNGSLIISPSRKLHDNCTEKLAATPDGSGGFWLLSHDYFDTAKAGLAQGRNFYAYHITSNSSITNLTPIISRVGSIHAGASPFGGNYWNAVGQMKFNEAGNRLALALYVDAVVELFHFDKGSGKLSFLLRLDQFSKEFPGRNIYGLEFSPSGNRLYVSTGYANEQQMGFVWGFDLINLNTNAIWNSRVVISSQLAVAANKYPFGALQTGPDGNIYIARNNQNFVDRITNPENLNNPAYQQEAIFIPGTCHLGLPTTVKINDCSEGSPACSYFHIDISNDTTLCKGDSMKIGLPPTPGYQYRWNTGKYTSYIYGYPGNEYKLVVIDTAGCKDIGSINIPENGLASQLKLPYDTVFCSGKRHTLSFHYPGVKYKWQNGSDDEYAVKESGYIDVQLYSPCDTVDRTILARLQDCSCHITMPTAFSPNNDRLNDFYLLKAPCELKQFHLEIFNRWGEKVFESKDIHHSWNGRVGERLAKPDVYVYLLEYSSEHNEPEVQKGAFTLIR